MFFKTQIRNFLSTEKSPDLPGTPCIIDRIYHEEIAVLKALGILKK